MKTTIKLVKYLPVVTTVALLLSACAEKKSSEVTAAFKMTGSSSNATVAQNPKGIWGLLVNVANAFVPSTLVDSTGLTVNLSQAWVVVKEVQFKTQETAGVEDSEIEMEFTGPYVVDLLSSSPLVLDTQKIAEKEIRRIKMKFHKAESLPAGAPAGLVNNSIYFTGTVGGQSFTFQMDDGSEVQIFGPSAFVPSENSEVLVEIQLANILKQINMSTITNGEVISASSRHSGSNLCNSIDPSANDIYTCVRKGLEKHANLGVDKDFDDDLDGADNSVK